MKSVHKQSGMHNSEYNTSSNYRVQPAWNLAGQAAILMMTLAVPAMAQQTSQPGALAPKWRPGKSLAASAHAGRDTTRMIIKFTDDFGARSERGALTGAASLAQLFRQYGGPRIEPLFTIPQERLAEHRQQAQRYTSRTHSDLSQYFVVHIPSGQNGIALLAALLARPEIENAYFAPIPVRPPGNSGNPVTPNFTNLQTYKSAAPFGVDADFALADVPAGAGTGVRIADIEYNWDLLHEDLQQKAAAAKVGPEPRNPFSDPADLQHAIQHGTAVLGILGADADAYGVTGIAFRSGIRTVASATANGESVANAVLTAMQYLQPGDIILIEQQTPGPNFDPQCQSYNNQGTHGQFGLVPVEFNDAEFDAIQFATSNGYHVIEAAGNGAQDLDLYTSAGSCARGDSSYIKFSLKERDSGAILVAAGTAALPHRPADYTNLGNRVDCYSLGEHVATLGFGDLQYVDPNNGPVNYNSGTVNGNIHKYYTSEFGGTSAAAAIVAGCTAILESHHAILYSMPYPPMSMRLLLRTSGTPSAAPREDRIGTQPNLRTQLQTVASVKSAAVVRGGSYNSNMGVSVAWSGGDANSELANFIVGSPNAENGAGRVDFISTATGDILQTWTGGAAGDQFGFSVACAGDLDHDGVMDSVVGAPGGGAGHVYIFSGYGHDPLFVFTGTGGTFGHTVTGCADLNVDGVSDVIIGNPDSNQSQASGGMLQIQSGANGNVILQLPPSSAGDMIGYAASVAGDINNDGISDILTGMPGAGQSAGGATIFSGSDGSVLFHWSGQVAGDQYGFAVAGVGDCNGDGVADVAVGAPFNSIGGSNSGRIYVYSGLTGSPLFRRSGDPGQRLGAALAPARDVNRDQYADVLVGAPGPAGDPNATDPGHVFVYSGATGSRVEVYTGEVVGDGFGLSLANGLDADGNSVPDFLIGAPFSNINGSDSGRVYSVLRSFMTHFGLASFGTGTPGCEGPQFIFAESNPAISNSGFTLTCSNAPRQSLGLVAIANAFDPAGVDPYGLGVLFHIDIAATTEFFVLPIYSNLAGYAATPAPIPNDPQLIGKTYIAQAFWSWSSELGGLCLTMPSYSGMSSSNGLWMTIQPH